MAGLQFADGQTAAMPMERALRKLELRWAPIDADGGGLALPQESEDEGARAMVDEAWLLRNGTEPEEAQRHRAGVLRAAGVLGQGEEGRLPTTALAHFAAGAAGEPQMAREMERALRAASSASEAGGGDECARGDTHAAAGWACAAALRAVADALGAAELATMARAAHAFRREMGVVAGAGAHGTFAARALRASAGQASARTAAASPPARRTSPRRRPTPPRQSQPTALVPMVDESPRARVIRQLLAEKAAEEADKAAQERARRAGARTLTFEAQPGGEQGDGAQARGMVRGPEAGPEGQPPAQRRRPAPGLEELRPLGAEHGSSCPRPRAAGDDAGDGGWPVRRHGRAAGPGLGPSHTHGNGGLEGATAQGLGGT
eukprot:6194048-Pleurochrysis_carterae.AAC.2